MLDNGNSTLNDSIRFNFQSLSQRYFNFNNEDLTSCSDFAAKDDKNAPIY